MGAGLSCQAGLRLLPGAEGVRARSPLHPPDGQGEGPRGPG